MISTIIDNYVSHFKKFYKKEPSKIIKELEKTEFNQIKINKIKKYNWLSITAKSENENRIEIIHVGEQKYLIYSFTHSSARWDFSRLSESKTFGLISSDKSTNSTSWKDVCRIYKNTYEYKHSRYSGYLQYYFNKYPTNLNFQSIKELSMTSNILILNDKYFHFGLNKEFKNIRTLIFSKSVNLPPFLDKRHAATAIVNLFIKKAIKMTLTKYPNIEKAGYFRTDIPMDTFILENFEMDSKFILPYLTSRYSFTEEEFISFKKNEFKEEFISRTKDFYMGWLFDVKKVSDSVIPSINENNIPSQDRVESTQSVYTLV